tara:strand:- start:4 stop:504 length:501 start_codon:yes stop_codon:yes gene_type:complete
MIIEFTKEHEGLRSPERANPSDAGLDVYADLMEPVVIEPGDNKMIPTGLHFGIPHGYMLQVCNRSSMGAKRSLVVGAHIIDSGYDGEVFVDIHNIGTKPQILNHEDKIAQLILVPVVHFRARETSHSELYRDQGLAISNRGDGALGSTDTIPSIPNPLNDLPCGGF